MPIHKNEINLTLLIALSWTLLFVGNHYLFQHFYITPYATLIFIPAGLRLMYSIIYREQSILGLLLGAVITSVIFHETSLLHLLFLPLASSVEPFLALILVEKIQGHRISFQWMSLQTVLVLSLMYAFLCPLAHITILALHQHQSWRDYASQFLAMVLGDFLGASLLLLLVFVGIRSFRRRLG